MTDGELLRTYARTGSEEAFRELVAHYSGMVYSVCVRRLGDAHDAEDAAQAVFIALARKAGSVRPATLARWLQGAALMASGRLLRERVARGRREREVAGMVSQRTPADHWGAVRPELDGAVAALPARYRDPVILHYLAGKPVAEVAAELGKPPGTVTSLLSRAVERLRERLSHRGVAVPAAALAGLLAEQSLEAVPAGLAAAVAAGATGSAAASPAAASLAEGTMRAMMLVKLKLAAAVIGAALAVGGGGGLVASKLLAGEAPAPPMGPIPAATGGLILDEGSPWRMFAAWNRPVVRQGAELKECAEPRFAERTEPPPSDWAQPDFADDSWCRWSLGRNRSREYHYGFGEEGAPSPTLSLLCLRGKFFVEDPAKVQKLTLALAYRGGVAVHVNGREVARGHLPKEGRIEPNSLAEDYPPEAFVHDGPQERGSNCIVAGFGHPTKFKDGVEKRIRRLENVTIDPKLLRKGVNFLAVELHRAPYFGLGLEKENANHRSVWSTAGLVSLALRAEGAVAPNTSHPAGIQVWTASDMRRPSPFDYADPLESRNPVSITGCQNGAFDGRVMISSDKAISGLKAQMGELQSGDGKGVIPASAVKLLYTVRDDKLTMRRTAPQGGFWYPLADAPPATVEAAPGGGALQSVLLKVKVPADAVSGDYAGKLTVSAEGLVATDVPVKLKVIGWKMPDPKEFATHMGVIQSPDSVALQYKVPPWSEEHWKLMEKSIQLLAELGNNIVHLPLITRSHWGNPESLVRWIKDGDKYKYDFTVFDRYLDMNRKHLALDVVILDAFDPWKYRGQEQARSWEGRQWTDAKHCDRVSLLDPASGQVTEMVGPPFSAPEAAAVWKPLLAEAKARLEQRGLGAAIMLGMLNERRGTKEDIAMFQACLPGAPWVVHAHPQSRGDSIHGIASVGYNSYYYVSPYPPPDSGKRYYGWQSKTKTDYWNRGHSGWDPLPLWRASVETVLGLDCSGMGYMGADFWPVLGSDVVRDGIKFSKSVCARYAESCWDQLNLDRGMEVLLAPGPAGAIPTEVFEQIRQGLQECQAKIFVERAILSGKLDPGLAKKCQEVLDQRAWHIRGLCCTNAGSYGGETDNLWYEGAGSAGLAEKLYATAAEVAAKTGAR